MENAKEKNGGIYNIKKPIGNKLIPLKRQYIKQHIFYCIGCDEELDNGCGIVNQWYFKHKKDSNCSYSLWTERDNHMSAFHKNLQLEFLNKGADIEVKIGNNRADVVLNDRVIEIQHSPISREEIDSRNENYLKEKGKYPIWILDDNGGVDKDLFEEKLLVINIDYWAIDMYRDRVKISFPTGGGLKNKDRNKKNSFNVVNLLKDKEYILKCFKEQLEIDKVRILKEKKEEKERLERALELERIREEAYEKHYQELFDLKQLKENITQSKHDKILSVNEIQSEIEIDDRKLKDLSFKIISTERELEEVKPKIECDKDEQ